LKVSQKVVTPVKTGVERFRNYLKGLDSGFRRNDDKKTSRLSVTLAIPKLSVLLAILLTSACTVGPDYRRPETGLPAQFGPEAPAGSTEPTKVSKEWWKSFSNATLDDLVEKALNNNKDVQIAVARIEEADAVLRQVGAALLPTVEAGASGTRQRYSEFTGSGNYSPGIRPNFKAFLSSTFELDFWGKLRRATESARAQALATRYGRDTVELTLSGLVTRNYLALHSLDDQIAVSSETLTNRETTLRITRSRFEGGIASQLDVQQAEGARAAVEAQIADLRRLRALSEHQLALLTGTPNLTIPEGDSRFMPVPPVPPAGLPSSLLESRPDIAEAEARLVAANAKIGVAKAALFPSISLTGSLGAESKDLVDLLESGARIWTLGFALNLPIFDSGKRVAKVDEVTAQQKQVLIAYQKAVEGAFKEVRDALVNIRRTAEGERALNDRLQATQKALKLAEARYDAGYSPYLEVLDAQRTQNDAQLAMIRNREARLAAAVDLFKALGGGWTSNP